MSSTLRWTQRSGRFLLAGYAVGIILILLYAGDPSEPLWWLGAAPFLAWAIAPVAATLLIARLQPDLLLVQMLSLIIMTLATISGIYIYIRDMFGEGARSTSALIFIFLPLYQWVFPLLVAAIVIVGSLWRRRERDRH